MQSISSLHHPRPKLLVSKPTSRSYPSLMMSMKVPLTLPTRSSRRWIHPPSKPKQVVSCMFSASRKQWWQNPPRRIAHACCPCPCPFHQTPSSPPQWTHQLFGSQNCCLAQSLSVHGQSSLPICKVSRTWFAPNGKCPHSLFHTCLIHSLGGDHSVELMVEGQFFFNWLVDPFSCLLTPHSHFITSLAPIPTMNGMFLNSSWSFSDSSVALMNDIHILSCNAGTIDQVSVRWWIKAALGRAPASTIAGNYIWVLMWVVLHRSIFLCIGCLWGLRGGFIKVMMHETTTVSRGFVRTGMHTKCSTYTQMWKASTSRMAEWNLGCMTGGLWTCRWSARILGTWYFTNSWFQMANIVSRWIELQGYLVIRNVKRTIILAKRQYYWWPWGIELCISHFMDSQFCFMQITVHNRPEWKGLEREVHLACCG